MDALQRWLDGRRASGVFEGLVLPAYVAAAAIAVAVAVGIGLWNGLSPGFTGGCSLHTGAALSGSSEVFARAIAPGCRALDLGEARATIAADFAFIPLYAVGGSALLWWLWPRAWRISRLRALRPLALVPIAAGAFDVIENAFVLLGLDEGPSLREGAARWAAVAGWWKWMLVVAAALATIACLCGALGNRGVPMSPQAPRRSKPDSVKDEIGICLSGGGIRSAGFALGALRAFDRRALLRRSRWITAVSGGAYAASAWFVGRGSAAEAGNVVPRPADGFDRLLEPPGPPDLFRYLRANRRYLSTGRGGLPATFVTGAAMVAFNVALLSLLVCLVSWPIGRLVATWAVQPSLRGFEYAALDAQSLDASAARLWLPGAFGLAVAALCWVVALVLWDPARARVLRTGALFAAGGAVLLALLAGIPVAVTETPKAWEAIHSNPLWGAGLASTVPVAALAIVVVWVVVRPFATAALRLGGVLLALLAVLLGGRVATDAAYGEGSFSWGAFRYGVTLGAFCLVYFAANAGSWSLFRLYYLRLRSTFATTQKRSHRAPHAPDCAGVYPVSLMHEPDWPDYRARPGPELVVCAAAQSNDMGVSGVRAASFTFSPGEIALRNGDSELVRDPAPYLSALRAPGRWGPRLGSVSAAVAMSGAAFTSAMGRHSLGTTNALLATLNVRLGAWMPNPAYPAPGRPLKKPRLGYLLKEVFGVYDRDDPYVYVTDGGHWENLGLVELLRRRAKWIFCVDASGDRADTFKTLEEAAAMARVECGAEIELDTEPLRRRNGRLPKTAVATWVIRYHTCGGSGPDECETGLLFYGKAMVAQDSPINTLSFSLRDRVYPRYPTYDQFLSEDELMNLVRLGEWVGRGLALEFERFRPPDVPGIPMAGPPTGR